MTQPQPQAQIPVQIMFNAGQGPDGKTWGVMVIHCGILKTELAIPPELLEQLAEGLPKQLTELNAQVRRANLGLVIQSDLSSVKPMNGRKP